MSKQLVQKSTMVNDNNNCTVLALKSVTGFTERKCYNLLKKEGRVDGRGFYIRKYLGKSKKIGKVSFKKIYTNRDREKDQGLFKAWRTVTLNSFCKMFPKGSYYVCVRGHALAIVDGNIIDNVTYQGDRRHVEEVWKVTGGKPKVKTLKAKKTPKRMPRLRDYDIIKYVGKLTFKTEKGKVLLKPGDKRSNYYWHVDYRKRVRLRFSWKEGLLNWSTERLIPREDFVIVGKVPLQDRDNMYNYW